MKIILISVFLFLSLRGFSQEEYEATWASIDQRPLPQWYTDAKFGIWIHWGVYSVPSWAHTIHDPNRKDWKFTIHYAEWYWRLTQDVSPFPEHHQKMYGDKIKYQDFVKDFKAEMYDPEHWAKIFENAGAKYVLITSKHHDGYCLWQSKYSWNWNSVDLNPHKDLIAPLFKAVKEKGMKMGCYYSLYEWYNPLYINDLGSYIDHHMLPQLKEMVTSYEPDIIYADGEWDHPSKIWKSEEFLAWLYNESPVKDSVVVNDRWGNDCRSLHGGYYSTEYGEVDGSTKNIPEYAKQKPFEEIRGIGRSFGYNRAENLEDYQSSEALVHMLVELVSKGGNLLLDVGPTADGRIPVIMQQRLADIGGWLKVNGEAIYGTRKWLDAPDKKPEHVFYTSKGNDIYVICTTFPETSIELECTKKPLGVSMLGYGGKIQYSCIGKILSIKPPAITPASNPCNYAWVFKVEGAF